MPQYGTLAVIPIRGGQLETDIPDSKDLMVVHDYATNTYSYLDLRTGKPYANYTPVENGLFSNGLADMICSHIREGKSLIATCQELKISQSQFYAWLAVYPEFKKRYTEARKQRADYHFHRALDIADQAMGAPKELIPGIKLAVDTHKWAAEKSDPERFAKPKEEGNNVGSITINLQTGVLDKQAPPDIVVDQFGNFKGFGTVEEEQISEETSTDIILTKDRWGVYDGESESKTEESNGDHGEEEKA